MKVILAIFIIYLVTVSSQFATDLSLKQLSTSLYSNPAIQDTNPNLFVAYGDNNFNIDDSTDDSDDDLSDNFIPIMSLNYNGDWNISDNTTSQQFGYFSRSSGLAQFTAQKDYFLDIDNLLIFTFYDGEFADQKYAVINFMYDNATDFYPDISTFTNDNISFFLYLFDDYVEQSQQMCEGSYKLSFMDSYTNKAYQRISNDYVNVYASLSLNSSNCGISISSTLSVKSQNPQSALMGYTIIATAISAIHIWTAAVISKNIIQSEPEGMRVSMISLAFMIGWDVFLCLFNLYSALTIDEFFHYFLPPAFWYFVLVSIFETRLILLVWKSKFYGQYRNVSEVRRGIVKFYLMFYGFLTGFLLVCYFFLPAIWVFYLMCPLFVPQIIHNVIRGQKYFFNKSFVFGLGLLRIILPLYARGCPNNIFRLTPNKDFMFVYTSLILAQIFILFLQSKLGSRFFVPACLLPPRYNYYVKVSPDSTTDIENVESCPICMEYLNQAPCDVKTPLMETKPSKKLRLMQTPCKHQFHEPCLKGWMDLKLECPSCRSRLPPID